MPRSVSAPLVEGGLHEVYAAAQTDAVSLSGCALMLACATTTGACLWVRHAGQDREAGAPSPRGLLELGVDPSRVVLLTARDPASVLQAALEGARCTGSGAVVVDLWGEVRAYDLTASRRLALAATATGRPVVMARAAARPLPSAARTRWQVRAMPSRALAANAPGPPAFEMTLLRARNGQEGLRYCVEWDRDARQFIPRSLPAPGAAVGQPAPLSGAVAAFSAHRQDTPWRHAG